jgi:hypothetical protein
MSNNMMKYIAGAAVVLMLIGAPMGSYFYLKNGLKYRLESQEQLQAKQVSTTISQHIETVRTPKTAALIHTAHDNRAADIELLKQVDERIVDRDHFEIISMFAPFSSERKMDIRFIADTVLFAGYDQRFVLVDSAGVVRNTYTADDDISKELIRHLSVVIPLPKHRDIRLRRELEK